jgi:hypothetical protein
MRTMMHGSRSSARVWLSVACFCVLVGTIGAFPGVGAAHSETAAGSAPPSELRGSEAVHFKAADGVALQGRLFGHGSVGIVLTHIADPEVAQAEWFSLAPVLASQGYRVLTFDFRGFCPGERAVVQLRATSKRRGSTS